MKIVFVLYVDGVLLSVYDGVDVWEVFMYLVGSDVDVFCSRMMVLVVFFIVDVLIVMVVVLLGI